MKIQVISEPVVVPPKTYTLTLNQPEMDVLYAVLGCIGGYDGPQGYREVLNHMYNGIKRHAFVKDILDGDTFPSVHRVAPTE